MGRARSLIRGQILSNVILVFVAFGALGHLDLDGNGLAVQFREDLLERLARETLVGVGLGGIKDATGLEHTSEGDETHLGTIGLTIGSVSLIDVVTIKRVHQDAEDVTALELTIIDDEVQLGVFATSLLRLLDFLNTSLGESQSASGDEGVDLVGCSGGRVEHIISWFWVMVFGLGLLIRQSGGDGRINALTFADFDHEGSEVGSLDDFKATRAILGGIPPRVLLLADESTILGAIFSGEVLDGNDLIEDARKLTTRLGALNLGHPSDTLEIVFLLVEDADHDDGHGGVLEMGEPADHLTTKKAVGTTSVGLAGLLGHGLGLDLRPLEALTRGDSDGVHEDGLILGQINFSEQFLDGSVDGRGVMSGRVGRIGATDVEGESTSHFPRMGTDGYGSRANVKDVAGPVLDSERASLKVHEQRGLGVKRASLCRLADPRRAEQCDVDFRNDLEAVIGLYYADHMSVLCWEKLSEDNLGSSVFNSACGADGLDQLVIGKSLEGAFGNAEVNLEHPVDDVRVKGGCDLLQLAGVPLDLGLDREGKAVAVNLAGHLAILLAGLSEFSGELGAVTLKQLLVDGVDGGLLQGHGFLDFANHLAKFGRFLGSDVFGYHVVWGWKLNDEALKGDRVALSLGERDQLDDPGRRNISTACPLLDSLDRDFMPIGIEFSEQFNPSTEVTDDSFCIELAHVGRQGRCHTLW